MRVCDIPGSLPLQPLVGFDTCSRGFGQAASPSRAPELCSLRSDSISAASRSANSRRASPVAKPVPSASRRRANGPDSFSPIHAPNFHAVRGIRRARAANETGRRSTLREEPGLAIDRAIPRLRCVTPIALHVTRAAIVGKVLVEDLVPDATHQARRPDWEEHFDAAIQIARHQIRAAQVDLLVAAIAGSKTRL